MTELDSRPNLVIPFTVEELAPETRALGERLGARFVHMPLLTSYWDLVEELWSADHDFIIWEHDVLPTEELIRSMWACPEPWCSGTYGRWWIDPKRRVLKSDSWLGLVKFGAIRKRLPDVMTRALGGDHMWPFLPERHFDNLCTGLERVLGREESLSPHLHFPAMDHLKVIPGSGPALPYRHVGPDGQVVIDPPWNKMQYLSDLRDLAETHPQPPPDGRD